MKRTSSILGLTTALALGLAADLQAQVTVDGVIYANFRYGLKTDSSFSPPAKPNNFDVVRSYLTVRSKSEGGIGTRVTVDVDGRKADSDQLTFRLKYAYVDYKPEGKSIGYRFGLVPTPITAFIETIWDYRMQGSVAVDRTKYVRSSDFGISAAGSWRDNAVNAEVGIFNGETYSKEPGDNRKDAAGRVSVRLAGTDVGGKTGGLRLTGFASYGKANEGGTRQRVMGMLSYHSKAIRLGAEYTATNDDEIKGKVMSGWGVYFLPDSPFAVIARVDHWDPDTDVTPVGTDLDTGTQTRVIGGVSYRLAPKVRLLLDADLLSAEGGEAGNSYDVKGRSIYFHTEIVF